MYFHKKAVKPPVDGPAACHSSEQKGGVPMSAGAWVMLIIYVVGLGVGSIALLAYSLRHNDI